MIGMLLAAAAVALTPPTQRPNIILLLADDHAAHAVSAYRKHLPYAFDLPRTPNLDQIARDGMLFTNAFVTNSICTPARAAVLTGQYGHLTGVLTNNDSLHPTVMTFPKLLRENGYQTAIFGKWHLRDRPTGFDRYEILPGQGSYYNPVLMTDHDSVRYQGYVQEVLTDHALSWVKDRDTNKPFFLMVTYNAPHRPWQPGPEQQHLFEHANMTEAPTLWDDGSGRAFRTADQLMTVAYDLVEPDLKFSAPDTAGLGLTGDALTRWKYQRFIKDYMRTVLGLDAAVGRLMDEIKRLGLADNTVIVYSSDQGFFLGDHGWFDKRWMYEESLRTPLLIKWPGVVRAGSINRDMVMNLDLAETFLDIAGVRIPSSMQGLSMKPLLLGKKTAWRDAIYYQYFGYPDWHMVRRQYGVRDQRYKLIRYYDVDKWELFDLKRDPHEMKSVYNDPGYRDVVTRMEKKLELLRAQYRAPMQDTVPYTPFELPLIYRRH